MSSSSALQGLISSSLSEQLQFSLSKGSFSNGNLYNGSRFKSRPLSWFFGESLQLWQSEFTKITGFYSGIIDFLSKHKSFWKKIAVESEENCGLVTQLLVNLNNCSCSSKWNDGITVVVRLPNAKRTPLNWHRLSVWSKVCIPNWSVAAGRTMAECFRNKQSPQGYKLPMVITFIWPAPLWLSF